MQARTVVAHAPRPLGAPRGLGHVVVQDLVEVLLHERRQFGVRDHVQLPALLGLHAWPVHLDAQLRPAVGDDLVHGVGRHAVLVEHRAELVLVLGDVGGVIDAGEVVRSQVLHVHACFAQVRQLVLQQLAHRARRESLLRRRALVVTRLEDVPHRIDVVPAQVRQLGAQRVQHAGALQARRRHEAGVARLFGQGCLDHVSQLHQGWNSALPQPGRPGGYHDIPELREGLGEAPGGLDRLVSAWLHHGAVEGVRSA